MSEPTLRFTGLAEIYASHRPTYPSESIDFILDHCGWKTGDVLADIGCGTGISTRLFAERGLRVIGIEPNADMRQKAQATPCPSCLKPPEYRGAKAESTGLADASVDAVLCAQAFHWFEPTTALAEFHRILKPGGWVALVWNERNESDPFTRAYGDIIRTAPDALAQETRRGCSGNALLKSNLFEQRQRRAFRNSQVVDRNGLIGRAFSASYAPKEDAGVANWIERLGSLFELWKQNELVTIRYECGVYLGQRKE